MIQLVNAFFCTLSYSPVKFKGHLLTQLKQYMYAGIMYMYMYMHNSIAMSNYYKMYNHVNSTIILLWNGTYKKCYFQSFTGNTQFKLWHYMALSLPCMNH